MPWPKGVPNHRRAYGKKEMVCVYFSPLEVERLEAIAVNEKKSMSAVVRQLIGERLLARDWAVDAMRRYRERGEW